MSIHQASGQKRKPASLKLEPSASSDSAIWEVPWLPTSSLEVARSLAICTTGAADAPKAFGVRTAHELAGLFGCKIVISMVPDDAAAHEIVFGRVQPQLKGLAAGLAPGAIHLSMSTISPTMSSVLAAEHARHNQGYSRKVEDRAAAIKLIGGAGRDDVVSSSNPIRRAPISSSSR